ncbi:sugar ABC transporter permease [Mycetocola tolaasinivorans]|uniref:Sugar ABC transporter permease n=1 Tax=Mycetocola tolaasinivorans TaxID=76635 RepID=A0A3L7A317_9MICO|nr:sugar ABC transporter permease [Mycetocola tolaasinivorans]RLP74716.1 sugar ABC transporter permease [Mycetocola tolaasinivorans]
MTAVVHGKTRSAGTPARPPVRQSWHNEGRLALTLLAPGVLVMVVVIVLPILETIRQSLFGAPGLDPATGFVNETEPFVALANYTDIFSSTGERFWRALGNTSFFAVATVVPETIIGVGMALIMNQALRARALVRVAILIPWAIPTALSGVLWGWIFSANGVANAFLPTQVLWTSDGFAAQLAVIMADTWKTAPFLALLVLAGLQTIPVEVYEAARVDGAGPWRRFIGVTLPLVRPALVVAILFRMLDALRMFDLPYVLIGPRKSSVETISMLAQDEAAALRYGSAAAYAIILFLYIFLIAFVFVRMFGADVLGARDRVGPTRAERRAAKANARFIAAASAASPKETLR